MTDKKKDMALLDWDDEISPISTEKQIYLEKQRKAWEVLEKNLEAVKSLPWENFDNVDSAKIPENLDSVHVLHQDIYRHPYLEIKGNGAEPLRIKRPGLYLNNGIATVSIFHGTVNTADKKEKDPEGNETIEKTTVTAQPLKKIPREVPFILDYLFGSIVVDKGSLYLVKGIQFILLSDLELSRIYKISKKGSQGGNFNITELRKVILFIDEQLKIKPAKSLKRYTLAFKDFQLDLYNKKLLLDTKPKQEESYFKVYDCTYREVMDLQPFVRDFYDETMNDNDSLHNATLQIIYTMLVACRLDTKRHFFVSKSFPRTGKSLRQDIIATLFENKTVELSNLIGGVSDIHWAGLDGGEMLIVPESGELTNMDRVLKILATNSTHKARPQGGNPVDVNLSGVLSIDTNEKVSFSSQLSSRAVNISFHDRPAGESDKAREEVFKPYWDNFTEQKANSSNLSPKDTAGIAFLIHSFLYWQSEEFFLTFRRVEMNNFRNTSDFGESQSYILEHQQKTSLNYTPVTPELSEIMTEEFGRNKKLKDQSMSEIGRVYKPKRWRDNEGNTKVTKAWVIEDALRAQRAITTWIESLMSDN
ncbi:hypothetical protein [Lactococcus petauri]|uniref:hypothetical protein n=1 Tax=Lactococcus petauri TaxID=1940789 RepID=UPI0022E6C13D|nr:hypothetical protein [Lactococcus petauri]